MCLPVITSCVQEEETEVFVESFLVPIVRVLQARELGTNDPGSKVEEVRLITKRGVLNKVLYC